MQRTLVFKAIETKEIHLAVLNNKEKYFVQNQIPCDGDCDELRISDSNLVPRA